MDVRVFAVTGMVLLAIVLLNTRVPADPGNSLESGR
jgi:hypothetical protein